MYCLYAPSVAWQFKIVFITVDLPKWMTNTNTVFLTNRLISKKKCMETGLNTKLQSFLQKRNKGRGNEVLNPQTLEQADTDDINWRETPLLNNEIVEALSVHKRAVQHHIDHKKL